MKKYQYNFKRYEKKYLLNEEQYLSLISMISPNVQYDRYRHYKICNIYFDTPQYDLIRNSIEKPIYKEKLRLRSYGIPKEDDMVFLEIKKKNNDIVYKRRISLPYKDAINYCVSNQAPESSSQITKEIDWIMTRYSLYPMLYLSYDRIAMKGVSDDDLRITFDSNIKWRKSQLSLTAGDFGNTELPVNKYIMEIKTSGAMPLWLTHILDSLKIYPQSYSKYGNIYKEHLFKESLPKKGGKLYA